jgi:hypothetical protein
MYLYLAAIGSKFSEEVYKDYGHADLDTIAKRGAFPSRPSDLFLKAQIPFKDGG